MDLLNNDNDSEVIDGNLLFCFLVLFCFVLFNHLFIACLFLLVCVCVCGGWKNIIREHFNEATPPAYRYAYSHTDARVTQI